MAAPFKILGIDHVVLRAADPAALERFYFDVLGLSFETRQGKLAQLRAGYALIDIVPADDAGPAGSRVPPLYPLPRRARGPRRHERGRQRDPLGPTGRRCGCWPTSLLRFSFPSGFAGPAADET
jgi:catechol 2,3-dioxygenase-like lactoylglutathione lyase family enzyme